MSVQIVTFADLGRKTNLKTIDIVPVISAFSDANELVSVQCRIADHFWFPKTRGTIAKPLHYLLAIAGNLTGSYFLRRVLEERICDMVAARRIGFADAVIFHPEYFFKRALRAAGAHGMLTIGIATMAHPRTNALLEAEECRLLGIVPGKMYQKLQATGADLKAFDRIVALSDFVRDSYIEAGYPASQIRVAATDVDTETYRSIPRTGAREGTFVAVYVADTTVLKGLHYLFDAWKMAALPDAELRIVGSFKNVPNELFKTYQDRAAADPTIRIVGHLSHARIAEVYEAASVFVFPSLTEGNPRVVMEAMASGLPVITTTSACGLVVSDTSGYVVPPRDPAAMADRLRSLYADRPRCHTMGMNAREAVCNKKPFGESVLAIYRESLHEKGTSQS